MLDDLPLPYTHAQVVEWLPDSIRGDFEEKPPVVHDPTGPRRRVMIPGPVIAHIARWGEEKPIDYTSSRVIETNCFCADCLATHRRRVVADEDRQPVL